MAGPSLTNIIAGLEALIAEAPDALPKILELLDNFATATAPEIAFLSKWFPDIKAMDATVIADIKGVVTILMKWGPALFPFVIKFLLFVNGLFGTPAVPGQLKSAAPPTPGEVLNGAIYPL